MTNEQGQSFDVFDQPVPEDWSVVGIYTDEIAEQKGTEVTNSARTRGFPLQVIVEQE